MPFAPVLAWATILTELIGGLAVLLGAPALSLVQTLPTGGRGGASGNAGILQMKDDFGAVANYGSSNVSQLVRDGDFIQVRGQDRPRTSRCRRIVSGWPSSIPQVAAAISPYSRSMRTVT